MSTVGSIAALASFLCLLPCAALSQPYQVKTLVGTAGLAGSANGTNFNASFNGPAGLALDSAGSIYLSDGNAIRKVTPYGSNWAVSTIAGVVGSHGSVDGTGSQARLNFPQGVAIGPSGDIFVADTYNDAIRKVTPAGVVTTLAGLAGPGNSGSADGTNSTARFNNPYGIAVAPDGWVYVADTDNNCIRAATQSGTNWVVSTIAGQAGTIGTNNGVGRDARFNFPISLVARDSQTLYVADFQNHCIRLLTRSGTNWSVSTIAGTSGRFGYADGPASTAQFHSPDGLAIDAFANLFVADSANQVIRKIASTGIVTTIAGQPGVSGTSDGSGSGAHFLYPYGLAINTSGMLFISDNGNFTVRSANPAPVLVAQASGNKLVLSWPIYASNTILQASSSLASSATWSNQTQGIGIAGDRYVYTNQTSGSSSFYRLVK